ncbi:leucine-rich repeat domain-containing protein [Roseburia sp. AM59-24XD]|uniref:leucine-rich repeat domain-containing protein n=1 Tax=Roseburia sp. AM59-24XD TaxID=2293138 RepID=UPI000E4CA293|nr:leucine-rich repeat domain-containing protein [Roseburia sp. AM59-24XD]RHP83641.1 hypothetical protein DXA20_12090 [Roseburia sp. AM59-24XD]
MKMKTPHTYLILPLLCLFLLFAPLTAAATAQASGSVRQANAVTEVTLYDMDSSYAEVVSVPASMSRSYRIPQDGTATYRVTSGRNCVQVSADGLVTTARTYWKKGNGYSYSVSEGEDYDYYTVEPGDAEITVTSGSETWTLTVHVKDYAEVYVDHVMDAYITANITADMSDSEIAEAIVKFPAQYDYNYRYQSALSMVIYGGGDCWASTNTIIRLAKRMGYDAWTRRANQDVGAGSGHVNALVEIGGCYYELEAGYSSGKDENGFRPYDVKKRNSLFSYYTTYEKKAVVYQYDGKTSEGEIEIPSRLGGYPVTALAKSALAGTDFTKVVLPDTLEKIGDYAFSACSKLREITIPASVEALGNGVFTQCDALEEFSIDLANPYLKETNHVIYTADGKTLVAAAGRTDERIAVPLTVEKIQSYAFYNCDTLKAITIPESVRELGEGCFGGCAHLNQVELQDGLEVIGAYCFRDNFDLSVIRIPSTVKQLQAAAFYGDYNLRKIYFCGDAPEFGSQISGTYYDRVFYGCAKGMEAYYPAAYSTWDDTVLSDHDGNGVVWANWTKGSLSSIEDAEVTLDREIYEYTGGIVRPEKITVRMAGKLLSEGEDYLVTYPIAGEYTEGTATVLIIGTGVYRGVKVVNYTIRRAGSDTPGVTESPHPGASSTPGSADQPYPGASSTPGSSDQPYPGASSTPGSTEQLYPGTTSTAAPARTMSPEEEEEFLAWLLGYSKPQRTATPSASPSADAEDEEEDPNLGEKFIYKNAVYCVTGTKQVSFCRPTKSRKQVTIPASVVFCQKRYKVTSIDAKACAGDTKLTRVTIGKNVTRIGKRAFWKCKKLKKVIYKGKKIRKKNIGKQAFSGTKIKNHKRVL